MSTRVIAYMLENVPGAGPDGTLTFCPRCAYKATSFGCVVAGLGFPLDMDDAIARMALAQVERGLTIDTPIPVTASDLPLCENCGDILGASSETAEESA